MLGPGPLKYPQRKTGQKTIFITSSSDAGAGNERAAGNKLKAAATIAPPPNVHTSPLLLECMSIPAHNPNPK